MFVILFITFFNIQMTSSVESLVSGFQKNILSSFTSETLGLAAQEIVDVRTWQLVYKCI